MTDVYISLGSNLKLPRRQIQRAINSLRGLPKSQILKASHLYLTKPYGIHDQPFFLNLNLLIESDLDPEDFFNFCQGIEKKQGRIKKNLWGSRTIDIDILLFGSLLQITENLIIPHAELSKRDFFIQPLLDINPDLILPNGEKLTDLLKQVKDRYILKDLGAMNI